MSTATTHPNGGNQTTAYRDDWREHAACRGPNVDPEWFYPAERDDNNVMIGMPTRERRVLAKQVCARCTVTGFCAAEAVNDKWSIRAGKTPEERGLKSR